MTEESDFIVKKEVIFTASSGNEVTKVTCSDGSIWYASTSLGVLNEPVGNNLYETSDGDVTDENNLLIDINDDRFYCWLSDYWLEREIKDYQEINENKNIEKKTLYFCR